MLEVRTLCKSYQGRQVLFPVSFRLGPGECLGIAGANGSGKSTLLRLLAQGDAPDEGQVLFQGRDVRGDRQFVRRQMGYVPQDSALAEELTVGRQLSLWQAACGLRGPLPQPILALMGLEPLLRRPIRELSGGQQRRVSIAMALLTEPSLLVMDEASAGLDESYRQALLDWLDGFLRRGGCLVWCTHRREELERLHAACLRLENGRPFWEGNNHHE